MILKTTPIFLATDESGGPFFGINSPLLENSKTGNFLTTFRDNEYIRDLNRTLQDELRSLDAYQYALNKNQIHTIEHLIPRHQDAGRQITQLILMNRGIPAQKTRLSHNLTRTMLHVASVMPRWVYRPTTLSALFYIERTLVERYIGLLELAPSRDLRILENLLEQTQKNLDGFPAIFNGRTTF